MRHRALPAVALALVAAAGCDPRRFDDLADELWFVEIERDATETAGDLGISLAALPGSPGVILVAGAGAPAGLAQFTLGADGELAERRGFDAQPSGAGPLAPLTTNMAPEALAPFGTTRFVAGVPAAAAVVRFDLGLGGGVSAAASSPESGTALAVAAGDLGLGGADPDVATVTGTRLLVFPDGEGPAVACGLRLPEQLEGLAWSHVAVADLDGAGPAEIIVTGYPSAGTQAAIRIVRAADLDPADGALRECPGEAGPLLLDGQAPVGLAVGDLDDDPAPEIAVGRGTVTVFLDPLVSDARVAITDDEASAAFGARLAIGDLDGDGEGELAVGDPGRVVGGHAFAGGVSIYDVTAGAATRAALIVDRDPVEGRRLGRALVAAPFPTPASARHVLAVGGRGLVRVFYKLTASGTDPRE